MNKRKMGGDGEFDVHDYLLGQGYRILAMNYSRSTGEIDVVAEKGGVIAFIEVKRRTSARYGRPAEAVTPAKQRRIVRTALLFLQERRLTDSPFRFDVLELLPGSLNHIESAFDATGMGAF